MTLHKITAPVSGYTGTVAGVTLANGTAETDNEAALSYFRRHGYSVEPVEEPEPDGGQGDDVPLVGPLARPAKSASKEAWKAFAIASGMSEEDADNTTRDALAEHYHEQGGDA
jgi:hypothetical protein